MSGWTRSPVTQPSPAAIAAPARCLGAFKNIVDCQLTDARQAEGYETHQQKKSEGAMEKGIIAAAGALAVVPLSILFYTSDQPLKYDLAEAATTLKSAVENFFPPKCDSPAAVATIKSMALEKINDKYRGDILISFYSRKYLGKNPVAGVPPNMGDPFSIEEVTMDSFRSQGNVGTGSRCAAQIGVEASGKKAPSEISVEYTIEPTTDGKTMVSARFRPSS
jgi:hypothetical protein